MKLINYRKLAEKLSVHPTVATRIARQEDFPKPVVLSPRRTRWIEEEVDNWIANYRSKDHERDGNEEAVSV